MCKQCHPNVGAECTLTVTHCADMLPWLLVHSSTSTQATLVNAAAAVAIIYHTATPHMWCTISSRNTMVPATTQPHLYLSLVHCLTSSPAPAMWPVVRPVMAPTVFPARPLFSRRGHDGGVLGALPLQLRLQLLLFLVAPTCAATCAAAVALLLLLLWFFVVHASAFGRLR